jgi:hypothetical protein
MIELDRSDYPKVSAWFDALGVYNVCIPALLDGINPGNILVDDVDHPQLVFMHAVTRKTAHRSRPLMLTCASFMMMK